MPALTPDQRVLFVKSVWSQFCEVHKVHRDCASSAEYELARKWALRGVPLAVVLQGINETGGKPRTLLACTNSVEAQISRWHLAMGSLVGLPAAGPLEESGDEK